MRLVTVDIASGRTSEYGYRLTTGSGVSEIVAVNDHQFLVDERDGKGLGDNSPAVAKSIFLVDINGATEISGVKSTTTATPVVIKAGTPFLDLVAALKAYGLTAEQIPSKIEGMAFGQDVVLNGQTLHTLYIANDNDFLPATAGANRFYVFGFTDADLPGFVSQQLAVPEPSTWGMVIAGFAVVGAMLRRRRPRQAPAFA